MKIRMIGLLFVALLLSGCGATETFETVADVPVAGTPADHRAVSLALPDGASTPVSDSEYGMLYLCDGYEITVQTMDGGDLERTIRAVSGYDRDDLTVMQTQTQGFERYDFVWAAAGEDAQQIARAAVIDDGFYHYVLTAQADASDASNLRSTWNGIFASFALG